MGQYLFIVLITFWPNASPLQCAVNPLQSRQSHLGQCIAPILTSRTHQQTQPQSQIMTQSYSPPNQLPVAESRPRDVQIAELGSNITVLRSRTWERLKFEVEYNRRQGTTANSYLLRCDRTALIDPPGESFTQIYLDALQPYLEEATLDYVVASHINPNRMATLAALVERVPSVTIVCSRPAAQALKAAFPDWSDRLHVICPPQGYLDLGQGRQLQLLPVPSPAVRTGCAPTTQSAKSCLATSCLGHMFAAMRCLMKNGDDWK